MKDWSAMLAEAGQIMVKYDILVTLCQLFYQLVSRELVRNTVADCKSAVLPLKHQ
jgi:hypothetical protein